MNLPNSITMSRIAMIPLFLWILSPYFPWQGTDGTQEIAACVLFVLASMTDGLDGYLARKRGQITTMGMLLDPPLTATTAQAFPGTTPRSSII
jgi:CDP-diacylglycerol---glycerol-3-phosphate 3-phosphatidyltransferase